VFPPVQQRFAKEEAHGRAQAALIPHCGLGSPAQAVFTTASLRLSQREASAFRSKVAGPDADYRPAPCISPDNALIGACVCCRTVGAVIRRYRLPICRLFPFRDFIK
jgi:hypothetical protein